MVSSTHYLASEAGNRALRRGGNVVDAGATMWFCMTVLKPHLVGVAGEVPILVYWADEGRVLSVNGQGPMPQGVSIDWFTEHGYMLIPEDGFLPAVVPGSFDAWLTLLDEYGTMSLAEVMEPAIGLAGEGFPVYPMLKQAIAGNAERYRAEWPASAKTYLPGGRVPEVGSVIRNPDWARTFEAVAEEERSRGWEVCRDRCCPGVFLPGARRRGDYRLHEEFQVPGCLWSGASRFIDSGGFRGVPGPDRGASHGELQGSGCLQM